MSNIKVRINGRGNAWPVILGQDHPFYNRRNYEDLANSSFSIIKSKQDNPKADDIEWELMVDAGHGAVQYLLKNCNRIPEAVFITHPHIDHTLGLDWIVQSYYKTYKKPYPVYATVLCWTFVKATYPQLKGMIDFKELLPFKSRQVEEAVGVKITSYPVYHGKSAIGAAMLFFKIINEKIERKVLFTGDILCPLLREEDYSEISEVDLLVTDANNRFPYPKSNHWSIIGGNNNQPSEFLNDFKKQCNIGLLLEPHINGRATDTYCRCFDHFLNKAVLTSGFHFTIESFVEKIQAKKLALVHYSGGEDLKYYQEQILNTKQLEAWANNTLRISTQTEFVVPYVSQHINF